MKSLSLKEFASKVDALGSARSVTGKVYHSIKVKGDTVFFKREHKSSSERIDLNELYKLFCEVQYPTNQIARGYISGRVQSPAVSILNALSTKQANPNLKNTQAVTQRKVTSKEVPDKKPKDEHLFFQALKVVLGNKYVHSTALDGSLTTAQVYLPNDFRQISLPSDYKLAFEALLSDLNSDFSFNGNSLSRFIDGVLISHPALGSRIIEFDEEQHFSPALRVAQEHLNNLPGTPLFPNYYSELLKDLYYLNNEALPKNRVKARFKSYPTTFRDFLVQLPAESNSGYIKAKSGFPFVGGRIAQRAYYDSLRMVAHLSQENKELKPAIRFPKAYFEQKTGLSFSLIKCEEIGKLIREYLREEYTIYLD